MNDNQKQVIHANLDWEMQLEVAHQLMYQMNLTDNKYWENSHYLPAN